MLFFFGDGGWWVFLRLCVGLIGRMVCDGLSGLLCCGMVICRGCVLRGGMCLRESCLC